MTVNNRIWDPAFTHWIKFRNAQTLGPVVLQSFMILCAFLVVLGLVYVILLVIAIAIHHVLFDRDPKKVPDYVKNSVQFSASDSEDSNAGDHHPTATPKDAHMEDSDTEINPPQENMYATTAKKLANLDKFMMFDNKK